MVWCIITQRNINFLWAFNHVFNVPRCTQGEAVDHTNLCTRSPTTCFNNFKTFNLILNWRRPKNLIHKGWWRRRRRRRRNSLQLWPVRPRRRRLINLEPHYDQVVKLYLQNYKNIYKTESPDNSVGIAADYGLGGRGSIPSRGKNIFSSPQRPDGSGAHPPSYQLRTEGVQLATHLHLVSRSRMVELYLHSGYVFMACCLIN
jgi:hypothetical protein